MGIVFSLIIILTRDSVNFFMETVSFHLVYH